MDRTPSHTDPDALPSSSRATQRAFISAVEERDFARAIEILDALSPASIQALRKDRGLLAHITEQFDLLDAAALLDVFGRGSVDPWTAYGALAQGSRIRAGSGDAELPEDPEETSEIIEHEILRAPNRGQRAFAEDLDKQRVPVTDQLELTGVLEGNPDWEMFFRVVDRFDSQDRYVALREVYEQDLWDDLLGEMEDAAIRVVQGWLDEQDMRERTLPLAARVQASPRPRRGREALARIDAVMVDDQHRPGRLCERLREVLVTAVVEPRDPADEAILHSGMLTPRQAERAARALVLLPARLYLRMLALLELTPPSTRSLQVALLLKVLGARLPEVQDPDEARAAIADIERFAASIRDLHPRVLISSTTVLQGGSAGRRGLQQRFQHACSVTAALAVRAEADPLEAFRIHEEGQLAASRLVGHVASETAEALEKHSDNRPVPRRPKRVFEEVHAVVRQLEETRSHTPLRAVLEYMGGRPADPDALVEGLEAIRAMLDRKGYPDDELLLRIRNVAPATADPGLDPWQLVEEMNSSLGLHHITGRVSEVYWIEELWDAFASECREGESADRILPRPLPEAWGEHLRSLLDRAERHLVEGTACIACVYWEGAGGRALGLHDVERQGAGRRFLAHDPVTGHCRWVGETGILEGHWPGLSRRGLLCGLVG